MKPFQIVLLPLAACLMTEGSYAAPATKAAPKKIVLPVKITACTQYLELADIQRKTVDRKQAVLDDLMFEQEIEMSIERRRNPLVQTPAAAGAPSDATTAAASKNSAEITMMKEELAKGSRVVAVLEDAYRRCLVNPQALAVKPPAKAAPVAQRAKAPAKRTVAAPREQNLRAATPPRTGHDPGASAIISGAIGGAIGGFAR